MIDFVANLIAGFIIFMIILAICFACWGIRLSQVGEGEHSGYITAVDQRGYIFRNYDVFFKTDNSSSQEDTYCVDRNDKELVKQAQEANKTRKQVTVHYHGVRGIGFDLCYGSQIDSIDISQ